MTVDAIVVGPVSVHRLAPTAAAYTSGTLSCTRSALACCKKLSSRKMQ